VNYDIFYLLVVSYIILGIAVEYDKFS